jgi:glycosyltransferase involved in cell wall biosynthesis
LLTLLWVFPTFAVGGAQTRFAAVANHLGEAARHIVISLDGRVGAREKLSAGLDISFADPGASRGVAGDFRRAARFLGTARADMLITSNWGAMDWAAANRLTRLPHVHTEDGFGPEEQDRQLTRRVLARRVLLRGSTVVLPSRTLLRLGGEVWRLPGRCLHYIPNGIDTAHFARARPMEMAFGEGPVVGTISVLRPEKNLARLFRAFALVRAQMRARLVIVGEGPERGPLEALAGSLGIGGSVLFAGHSQAPERWLAAFDVFALSSDTEQMPLSLLEAMAAGRAAASTDVGDVRDMLGPASARFVVARDDAAMAGAIGTLLADPGLARDIGRGNAALAADRFDQAAMFVAWREVLGMAAVEAVLPAPVVDRQAPLVA